MKGGYEVVGKCGGIGGSTTASLTLGYLLSGPGVAATKRLETKMIMNSSKS